MAIKIAKAMGAYVTVFTSSPAKVTDAKRLGADAAVLSSDKEQMRACPPQDMILDTVSAEHEEQKKAALMCSAPRRLAAMLLDKQSCASA